MELSKEQKYVLYHIVSNVRKGKMQTTLGGYAGTGKTTMIKYLKKFFPDYSVVAYTGKAANVLRRKGIQASTIHSLIYQPMTGHDGEVHFSLASRDELGCNGIIIDEASMVSDEIYDDLKSFSLPLIFVGDHGQLEPINSDFNLMANPEFKLEEIHRNAGDIAHFANHLRQGYTAASYKSTTDKVVIMRSNQVTDQLMANVEQCICGFNKTRVMVNQRIRAYKGYQSLLEKGERIICLRNNKQLALFNGMQGTLVDFYQDRKRMYFIDFQFEDFMYTKVWVDLNQFGKEKNEFEFKKGTPNPFDYAYCCTAHKTQGDEFDSVLVIEQRSKQWDFRRWAYTCASRAREKLYWVLS
jgi:ATP-dependent exoDNAse (exonuclease V) alpha subunit